MPVNIAFFASDRIAIPAIEYLHKDERVNLVGVVTQQDKPKGRGKHLQANEIKLWAQEHDIECWQPKVPREETVEWLDNRGVHLVFVMAYGHILKQDLLDQPKLGIYNLHGSILPAYRGASPVETAIAQGDDETGMTLMKMVLKMDAGDIVGVERVTIDEEDTGFSLRQKMALSCVPLLERHLHCLIGGYPVAEAQEEALVTYTRKFTKEDGWVDFNRTADAIYNHFRACQPWPGGFFEYDGVRIKVGGLQKSGGLREPSVALGDVVSIENGLEVAVQDGTIVFTELQKPGGKIMPVNDFLRGFAIPVGAQLTGGCYRPLVAREPFPYKK